MPIVMSDMVGHRDERTKALTATCTLTIEVDDENDNPSQPGTQNIHVYNYKGNAYLSKT